MVKDILTQSFMALPTKKEKIETPFNQSDRCKELICLLMYCLKYSDTKVDELLSKISFKSEKDFIDSVDKLIEVKNIIKRFKDLVKNKNNPCNQYGHGNS